MVRARLELQDLRREIQAEEKGKWLAEQVTDKLDDAITELAEANCLLLRDIDGEKPCHCRSPAGSASS
jgi:hypothetical protein